MSFAPFVLHHCSPAWPLSLRGGAGPGCSVAASQSPDGCLGDRNDFNSAHGNVCGVAQRCAADGVQPRAAAVQAEGLLVHRMPHCDTGHHALLGLARDSLTQKLYLTGQLMQHWVCLGVGSCVM